MKVKILIAFLCLYLGIVNVKCEDDATENTPPGIDPFVPPLPESPVVPVESDASEETISGILDDISTEIPDETQSENDNIEDTHEINILEENKIDESESDGNNKDDIPKSKEEKFYRGKTRYTSNGPDEFGFSYSIGDNDEHTRDEQVTIERGAKSIDSETEDEEDKITARGSYSFVSADGFQYTVNYVADGKGYRPQVLVSKV